MMVPPLLTHHQVALILGIRVIAVRRLARKGLCPVRQPDGRFLYRASDVAHYLPKEGAI
ncbi:helix-turn-helix domain-containing protein [Nonomuraea angiospora]